MAICSKTENLMTDRGVPVSWHNLLFFHKFLQSVQPVNRRIVERVRIVLVDVADVGMDVHGGVKYVFRFA